MAEPEALEALDKTKQALQDIQTRLRPFLQRIQEDSDASREQRALAKAAVALSIGTLRVMGARLRGLDRGRLPNDPLRQELNRIRNVLVETQQRQKEAKLQAAQARARKVEASAAGSKRRKPEEATTGTDTPSPRKKLKR